MVSISFVQLWILEIETNLLWYFSILLVRQKYSLRLEFVKKWVANRPNQLFKIIKNIYRIKLKLFKMTHRNNNQLNWKHISQIFVLPKFQIFDPLASFNWPKWPWKCLFVCNRGDTIQYHGVLWSRELGQAPMLLVFLFS